MAPNVFNQFKTPALPVLLTRYPQPNPFLPPKTSNFLECLENAGKIKALSHSIALYITRIKPGNSLKVLLMFLPFFNKILQRYVAREWFRTFIPSFLCFEFLIFLGFGIQLLHKGLDIIALRMLIPHLFIQATPYSIPSALLTATSMAYGRMSSDREVLAIQSSGINIYKIIMPVLVIGGIFCLITVVLSSQILPMSCYRIMLLQERAINSILAGRMASFQKKVDLHPYQIYIGKVEDNVNKDIVVIEYADDYVMNVIIAEEGAIEMEPEKNKIRLILYRGEFIKPNYKKIGEAAPRIGAFYKTTFEIQLKEKKRESSTKYMTVLQLFQQNRILNKELAECEKAGMPSAKDKESLSKKLFAYQTETIALSENQNKLTADLKRSNENLERQMSRIEGMGNEIKVAKNYILVASENIIQVKRESRIGRFKDEDKDKKVEEIRETIGRETQRIYGLEQKIAEARELQNAEIRNIASLTQSVAEVAGERDGLLKKTKSVEYDLGVINKDITIRKNDISAHKRLSQAFSCLTFIVIGIPLGIRLRSGNLMVAFGASFMVILFIYYPLVVAGIVLAEDTQLPVVPVLWGANILLTGAGFLTFRKLIPK